jgi:hypothetical protein
VYLGRRALRRRLQALTVEFHFTVTTSLRAAGVASVAALEAFIKAALTQPSVASALAVQWGVAVTVAEVRPESSAAVSARQPSHAPVLPNPPAVLPPLPASSSSSSSSDSSGIASLNLYVIIGALVFALLAACAAWLFVRARRQRGKKAALQKSQERELAPPELGASGESAGKGRRRPPQDRSFWTDGFDARDDGEENAFTALGKVPARLPRKQGGGGGSGSGGIFSIDALAVTLESLGESDDAAHPVGEKGPNLSAADESGVFEIPFEDLALEPRPFARGGGGQVMYCAQERACCALWRLKVTLGFIVGQVFMGKYGVHAIAAKQVYSTDKSAGDFEREAATLAKLNHPFIMQLFGISRGKLGATMVVVCGWDQKKDKGCG